MPDPPRSRTSLVLTAALVVGGAAMAAAAVGTGHLRLQESGDASPSAASSARQRCESEVLKRLVSPKDASLSDVHTETGILDFDGRDLFPLTLDEPLKGVDATRITVLNVSGVANSRNAFGSTIQDHFDCRGYFVDGSLVHTLVVFDHAH
jgi:hypothetical protein